MTAVRAAINFWQNVRGTDGGKSRWPAVYAECRKFLTLFQSFLLIGHDLPQKQTVSRNISPKQTLFR